MIPFVPSLVVGGIGVGIGIGIGIGIGVGGVVLFTSSASVSFSLAPVINFSWFSHMIILTLTVLVMEFD